MKFSQFLSDYFIDDSSYIVGYNAEADVNIKIPILTLISVLSNVTGTGTENRVVKWSGPHTITDSAFFDNGNLVKTLHDNNTKGLYLDFANGIYKLGNGGSNGLVISPSSKATFSSSVTATEFIRVGGLPTQFLKADGSVDDSDYQQQITLTTLGTSGPATLIGNTLNIPNYAGGGGGGTVASVNNILPDIDGNVSLTTSDIPEGTNEYFTQLRARQSISSISPGLIYNDSTGELDLSQSLNSLNDLTYASLSFVKMTAAGTFALDTNTYITSSSISGTPGFLSKFGGENNLVDSIIREESTTAFVDGSLQVTGRILSTEDSEINNVLIGLGGGNLINNTRVGYAALSLNTTGENNLAFGQSALQSNTTGSSNVAIGSSALLNSIISSFNIAIGKQSLYHNTGGGQNIAIGLVSGYNTSTGQSNTFIGTSSGYYNTTGNYNIIIGADAQLPSATQSDSLLIATGATAKIYSPSTHNIILGGVIDNGLAKLQIGGALYIGVIEAISSDTDKFLMSDGGVIKYITGANLATYIGAAIDADMIVSTTVIPNSTDSSGAIDTTINLNQTDGGVIPIELTQSFRHIQSSSSSSWVITHNLGYRPSVTIIDLDGDVVNGDIVYNTLNQLTLNFSTSIQGEAYLN